MPKPRPHNNLRGSSTPDGPGVRALQRYVMLLSVDASRAAELFTADGVFRAQKQGKLQTFRGREQIARHLGTHRPDLSYSLSFFRQDGECAMAEITIDAPDWGKVTEMVLVRMEGELIAEFEIINW